MSRSPALTTLFKPGLRLNWVGVAFEVRNTSGAKLSLANLLTGELQVVSHRELAHALLVERTLHIIRADDLLDAQNDFTHRTLDDYPPKVVAVAQWRYKVIAPLVAESEQRWSRSRIASRIAELRIEADAAAGTLLGSLSFASVYRWLKAYVDARGDLRALIPATHRRGGKGLSRLTAATETALSEVVAQTYLRPERSTVDDVWQLTVAALSGDDANRLSRTTVYRRLKSLDAEEVLTSRQGKRNATRELKQTGEAPLSSRPLERVEIDHTIVDLIAVDEADGLPLGRLTLTYCLDVATRYPLGYYLGFDSPGYFAVAQCLHHAILPKADATARYGTRHRHLAYGLPAVVVTDGGPEFLSSSYLDAAQQLGFVTQVCPVRTPEFKGGVERLFRTQAEGLFHTLPGTTFSNPIRRGDYSTAREACLTLGELDRVLNLYMLDIYAERVHRGLSVSPAQAWGAATSSGFTPALPGNSDELAILLGETRTRKLHHYGIDWDNLRYNAPELGSLRHQLEGNPVKVKRSPGDLSRIYIYDPYELTYHEVPILPSLRTYAEGLSLWKHRVVLQFARTRGEKTDPIGLGQAKQAIQEIVAASRKRKKLGRSTARWETPEPASSEKKQATQVPIPPPPMTLPDVIDTEGWEISRPNKVPSEIEIHSKIAEEK